MLSRLECPSIDLLPPRSDLPLRRLRASHCSSEADSKSFGVSYDPVLQRYLRHQRVQLVFLFLEVNHLRVPCLSHHCLCSCFPLHGLSSSRDGSRLDSSVESARTISCSSSTFRPESSDCEQSHRGCDNKYTRRAASSRSAPISVSRSTVTLFINRQSPDIGIGEDVGFVHAFG